MELCSNNLHSGERTVSLRQKGVDTINRAKTVDDTVYITERQVLHEHALLPCLHQQAQHHQSSEEGKMKVLEMSPRLCAHRLSPLASHKMAYFVESGQNYFQTWSNCVSCQNV